MKNNNPLLTNKKSSLWEYVFIIAGFLLILVMIYGFYFQTLPLAIFLIGISYALFLIYASFAGAKIKIFAKIAVILLVLLFIFYSSAVLLVELLYKLTGG